MCCSDRLHCVAVIHCNVLQWLSMCCSGSHRHLDHSAVVAVLLQCVVVRCCSAVAVCSSAWWCVAMYCSAFHLRLEHVQHICCTRLEHVQHICCTRLEHVQHICCTRLEHVQHICCTRTNGCSALQCDTTVSLTRVPVDMIAYIHIHTDTNLRPIFDDPN